MHPRVTYCCPGALEVLQGSQLSGVHVQSFNSSVPLFSLL